MVEPSSTYECYQIAGIDALQVDLDVADHLRIRDYGRAFFKNLTKIGMPETLSAGMLTEAPEPFVGLEFTPTEVFQQTPGTGAGERMEP